SALAASSMPQANRSINCSAEWPMSRCEASTRSSIHTWRAESSVVTRTRGMSVPFPVAGMLAGEALRAPRAQAQGGQATHRTGHLRTMLGNHAANSKVGAARYALFAEEAQRHHVSGVPARLPAGRCLTGAT